MFLLDTNTLIYLFKQQGQVAAHLQSHPAREVFIPSVVLFELEYGVVRSTRPALQRAGIDLALKAYGVVGMDYASAKAAAGVKHTLEVAGTPIGPCDQLIAGIALANDMVLVTRNTREFERVPGLRVENWYD
nr:type II toxin-antitoxin system VapC family toxin [uncultured Albidiferax sp.]